MMMRLLMGLTAMLIVGMAWSQEVVHTRGEFRFSVGPEPGFVLQHQVPDAWEHLAPGHDETSWRFWLLDEQVDRRANRHHAYTDYVYEPKSAALIGDAGRFKITFSPDFQRLVIHRVELRRNGSWQSRLVPERISLARREAGFEQDLADGDLTALIVLDDVRVNDVVRVRYSVIGSNPIMEGLVTDSRSMAWRSPVLDSRLRVLHEPGSRVRTQGENGAPEASIRRTPEATEIVYQSHAMPAYVDEGSYPVWYQPYPAVWISLERDWSDIVDWSLSLFPATDALPADLEVELAKWAQLPEPWQRLDAALRSVQDNVRYFGIEMGDNTHRPVAPGLTWTRRFGDCKDKAYLLVSLLGRLGIPAVPALLSTTKGSAVQRVPPSASAFDHVVVRAQLGDKVLWLDPTMTAEGGDPRLSDLSFYGVALPVAAGASAFEAILPPAGAKPGMQVNEHYALGADGKNVKLEIATVYRGRLADRARRSVASTRGDDMSRRYAEYYRKRFGELSRIGEPVIEDDRVGNVLRIAEEYSLKAPMEGAGMQQILEVHAESLSVPTTMPATTLRHGPLHFAMPASYRHEIQVDSPLRWSPSLSGDTLSYSAAGFAYTREIKVAPGNIHLIFDLDILDRDIEQAQVASHVGELRKLRESLYARLQFQLPADLQRQERDNRLKALLKSAVEGGARP